MVQIISRNVWKDLRFPVLALATVTRKNFNGKFTAKIDFPIGYFILPLLMLLFVHMLMKFEQTRTVQHFDLFDKKKLTILTKR